VPIPDSLPGSDVVTLDEVAQRLGLHRVTIVEAISRGEIPGFKIGRQYRIPRAWLDAALGGRLAPQER
jgi:excisionase family DNA binding protein